MGESYTRQDVETWLEEHPWDADYPEEVWTQTLGFHAHVLNRRTAELGGAVREQFEAFMGRMDERRRKAIWRYFDG